MRFHQVDVFTDTAFRGNPLAVFPDARELDTEQMQRIATEMNLSETTFVTGAGPDSYDVRIFTPGEELPFAGHPTLGTAWVLRDLGLVTEDRLIQRSPAGETRVWLQGDSMWFERPGASPSPFAETHPKLGRVLADAVGLSEDDLVVEARELGRAGRLAPAVAEVGIDILVVPVKDLETLGRCSPSLRAMAELPTDGCYCFTPTGAGRARARGFFPEVGVPEDPATGSACAGLGIYLAERLGAIELTVEQGIEMGRPSKLMLDAEPGLVRIGGGVVKVLEGELAALP